MSTTDDKIREMIGQRILDACAGFRTEVSLLAHADALGTSVGAVHQMAGESIESADAVIDEIAANAKAHMRQHWGTIETA